MKKGHLLLSLAKFVTGLMVLSLSHFTMNAEMGLLTSITILVALFLDLPFLPGC